MGDFHKANGYILEWYIVYIEWPRVKFSKLIYTVFFKIVSFGSSLCTKEPLYNDSCDSMVFAHSDCLPQFENGVMARVYGRSITRSTMYQNATIC